MCKKYRSWPRDELTHKFSPLPLGQVPLPLRFTKQDKHLAQGYSGTRAQPSLIFGMTPVAVMGMHYKFLFWFLTPLVLGCVLAGPRIFLVHRRTAFQQP